MNNKYSLLLFIFIKFSILSNCQNYIFSQDTHPVTTQQGVLLPNPFAGGLNSIQVNKLYLDADLVEDLVLFDKSTSKITTYLALNNKFVHAPEYETFFPEIKNWLIIEDYNGDGNKDIFTASLGTYQSFIKVYKNISTVNFSTRNLRWLTVADGLKSKDGNTFPNYYDMQVNYNDYPAIHDMDSDGDLDFLIYNAISGIEFHKNNSKEQFNKLDSLNVFEKYHSCWGKINIGYDCGNLVTINQTCPYWGGTHDNQRIQHNGSTITVVDLNGDGLKDLLLGDVSCTNVYALTNTGTNLIGKITKVNPNFPPSKPVNINSYPAVFLQDVDFDGVKDLLTSPTMPNNNLENSEFTSSFWYYKNLGTNTSPNFNFVKDNFLQETMIDVGEKASPALIDYDKDGDLDLFVGNRGQYHGSNYYATIALYENIGTKLIANFTLKTNDYLSLSGLNLSRLVIGFEDINKDGATDLYFFNTKNSQSNSASTQISYILNTNSSVQGLNFNLTDILNFKLTDSFGENLTMSNYSYDSPTVADIDNDGLKDLLLGKESGYIQYFRNTGTAQIPSFKKVTNIFGGIENDYKKADVALVVANLNSKDTTELVSVDNSGLISIYPNFKTNLTKLIKTDSNIIFNKITKYSYQPKLGKGCKIAAGDLNGDSLIDFIIGTGAGGLIYYKNSRNKMPIIKDTSIIIKPLSTSSILQPYEANLECIIFPNPATEEIRFLSTLPCTIEVYNAIGIKIYKSILEANISNKLTTKILAKGIYFATFHFKSTYSTHKFIVE